VIVNNFTNINKMEQLPLTSNYWTQHNYGGWKSRSCLGTGTKMWLGL